MTRASALRRCPVCRSKAVSAIVRTEDGDGRVLQVNVRCGECATWRERAVGWRAADALERRVRRDCDRMAAGLWQGERWVDGELDWLVSTRGIMES